MSDTNREGVGQTRAIGAGSGGVWGSTHRPCVECGPAAVCVGEPWPPALHVRGRD